ncbi:hypothetical protein ACSBR2_034301 [Camellia fascicularis]
MIKTGMRRSINGGGGRGGNTTGNTRRDTVKTAITMRDLKLNINLCGDEQLRKIVLVIPNDDDDGDR